MIGHGPHGVMLAREVASQVRAWDRLHRPATARFTLTPVAAKGPKTSHFSIRMPHSWLAVDWG